MEKMLPKVLQKESDINSATRKKNTQNSGNILNDRFSSEWGKERKKKGGDENNTFQLKRNWMILVLKLKLAPEKSLCQLAVQSEVSKFSVHWAIILLKQHVHKTELNNSFLWTWKQELVLQVVSRIRSQWIS